MFCPGCGTGLPEAARFCKGCGRAIPASRPPSVPKARFGLRAVLVTVISLALFPVAPFMFALVDAVRESVLFQMMDEGWPPVAARAGAREVLLKAIQYPGGNIEWKGFAEPPDWLFPDGWVMHLPREAIGRFDASCGRSCVSSMQVSGFHCTPPFGGYTGSSACTLHFWRRGGEQGNLCFVELTAEKLPEMVMSIDLGLGQGKKPTVPREMTMECPRSFRWVPQD